MAQRTHTSVRSKLQRLAVFVSVGAVGVLIVANLFGTPLLVGFVESGSMEPTIMTGDGFVALPPAAAGDVGVGDVVVFEASTLDGGGLTLHRIVDETPAGYITKGDANPITDQASGEPPVADERIVAVVWQPQGDVVTLPHLGTASLQLQAALRTATQRLSALTGVRSVFGIGVARLLLLGVSLGLVAVLCRRDSRPLFS